MNAPKKPILCLDFDGVIHSYTSGWKGACTIPDPPVDGAIAFIAQATERFDVNVFSSRSNQPGGIAAMASWLFGHMITYFEVNHDGGDEAGAVFAEQIHAQLKWPTTKPPAMVTIDDRAVTFTGKWPALDDLLAFKPWNKK